MSTDPNRDLLYKVASALGDLKDEMVFVGGCIAGLLITDDLSVSIRPTVDVDTLVPVATLGAYHQIETRLSELGFSRAVHSEVICRWQHKATGAILDVMPTDPKILGFANRWYPEAIRSSTKIKLRDDIEIYRVSAPAFIATKLEAFVDRGHRDLYSHDLEDILNIIDGRPELIEEVSSAHQEMQIFIAEEITQLLDNADFKNLLPGLLQDGMRALIVLERMKQLAKV